MHIRLDIRDILAASFITQAAKEDGRTVTQWARRAVEKEAKRVIDERLHAAQLAAEANLAFTEARPVSAPKGPGDVQTVQTPVSPPPWAETPTPVHAPPKEVFMPRPPTQEAVVTTPRARRLAREAAQPPLDETGYHVGRPWEDGEGEVEQ